MSKKLKILQINKFFFLKGGSEKYFFDLSNLLAKKGHQVIPWSMNHPFNPNFSQDLNLAPYIDFFENDNLFKKIQKNLRIFWNKKAEKKLEQIIKSEKPDIAHLHNFLTHLSPSIIWALKKNQIPIIMTLHDYKLFCPNYKFFTKNRVCFQCLKKNSFLPCIKNKCIHNSLIASIGGCLEAIWQKKILKLINKIDCFVAPSLFIKSKAIKAGVPEEKIIYLPNFLDDSSWNKNKTTSDQLIENYFFYYGRLDKSKGMNLLIESFLEFFEKVPGWKLKIAGEGPETENLKILAKNNLRIEFLGKKNQREIRELINKSYAVVVPSLWPENMPYTALESMALGAPIIGSARGGLKELINHKKNGLLFSPKKNHLLKNLNWSIDNPIKMKSMGKNASNVIYKRCHQEKHYQKIIKIYYKLIQKNE